MRQLYYIAIIFVIIVSLTTTAQSAANNASLNVVYSVNSPIIDGQWTTSTEWTDSNEQRVINSGLTAYIRTKHNSSHLFILVDFVSDQTGGSLDSIATYDYCGIFFDTLNDGGSFPKSDDYLLSHYYSSKYATSGLKAYVARGTGLDKEGSDWTEIPIAPGFSLVRGTSSLNNPYESKPHRVYEASVPMAVLGDESIGFYVFVRDANVGVGLVGTILEYPLGAGGKTIRSDAMADLIAPAPENWGPLMFASSNSSAASASPTPTSTQSPSSTVVPDTAVSFNEIMLIAIAVLLLAIIALVVKNRSAKKA